MAHRKALLAIYDKTDNNIILEADVHYQLSYQTPKCFLLFRWMDYPPQITKAGEVK